MRRRDAKRAAKEQAELIDSLLKVIATQPQVAASQKKAGSSKAAKTKK
jgi:hypothetical protein